MIFFSFFIVPISQHIDYMTIMDTLIINMWCNNSEVSVNYQNCT